MTDIKEIVAVKQLPVIEERLKSVKENIQKRIDTATSLICTEETIKEIKKTRAELNKEYGEYEKVRKQIKAQVMQPYDSFEQVYKECVSDMFRSADETLRQRISEVEGEVKKAKEQEILEYFEEYKTAKGVDFLKFEEIGICVTLSASKKSLKEQVKKFTDKVAEDIEFIRTINNNTEILVEYKQCLNITQAMATVARRNELISMEQDKSAEDADKQKKTDEAVAKVEQAIEETSQEDKPLSPPQEVKEKAKLYTTSFKVTGTLEQLKALKRFLEEGGYTYEQ